MVTSVASIAARERARRMIESLRSFGGDLAGAPVLLFEADPGSAPCGSLAALGVRVLPPRGREGRAYVLAHKVWACARAEALAPPGTTSLIWLNPDVLVVRSPLLLDLEGDLDAAVRPVHVRNVGLPAGAPLDPYWRGICEAAGVEAPEGSIESFVDGQRIRPYFNTHAFAVAPGLGLLERWRVCFERLVADRTFQREACADERHRIFLHQAVLGALIAGTIAPPRLRALPPEYAYPYNLQASIPTERRARALETLVCVACEDRSLDPVDVKDIAIAEPLRSWLRDRAGETPGARRG